MPEVAAAMPSATEPAAGQPAAATSEEAAQLPAEAPTASPPAGEPVETIVATNAKAEPLVTAERPAKDEEPAPAGARETDLTAPENAVPAEAPPAAERPE
jgi:hypothetical protein